jgi:hypothetical protein
MKKGRIKIIRKTWDRCCKRKDKVICENPKSSKSTKTKSEKQREGIKRANLKKTEE